MDHDFEAVSQKDISSIPLSEIKLPKMVFLIVKKEIELETKYLKDYPEWQFLPQNELKRKTIEIHFDLKTAKRICNKLIVIKEKRYKASRYRTCYETYSNYKAYW